MWVRVSVRDTDAEAVVLDLLRREAAIGEADWRQPRTVIRALAPLRNLLGYPQALAQLVSERPELQMWPSHYQTMPHGPGDGAAS
jgi:translation elongation factor EF-G